MCGSVKICDLGSIEGVDVDGVSTNADSVFGCLGGSLQLKSVCVSASVRRQAARQARRRVCRQVRRCACIASIRRLEQRRKEGVKRRFRRFRDSFRQQFISICLGYFCALFGFDLARPSIVRRLAKQRRHLQHIVPISRYSSLESIQIKKSEERAVHSGLLRIQNASHLRGWVGVRRLGIGDIDSPESYCWLAGCRWVDRRRLRCVRHSPGCGLNRRRRCSSSLSVFTYNVGDFLSVSSETRTGRRLVRDVPRSRCFGEVRAGLIWLESCGSRIGKWRSKCFQRVIISCFHGAMQECALRHFRKRCQNSQGSGRRGNVVESANFTEAVSFLRCHKCCVRVFSSTSQLEFASGDLSGGWLIGDAGGRCVGAVVWLSLEKHAMRLRGSWEGFGVVDTQQAPPWLEFVVGAPKGRPSKENLAERLQRFGEARAVSAQVDATTDVVGQAGVADISVPSLNCEADDSSEDAVPLGGFCSASPYMCGAAHGDSSDDAVLPKGRSSQEHGLEVSTSTGCVGSSV